jgi:type I restriction enzyme S subunit
MSLSPYPKYKDSGFEWLGEIPENWKIGRLKFGFDLQKRPIETGMDIVTAFRDGEVTLRRNRRIDGYTEGDKQIGYQGIEPGDLVIHAMDAFAGAIGVSDSRGKSTPVYSVCLPKPGVDPHYFALALRHLARTGYIESLSKGIRERSTDFRWADAKNVVVPVPPFDEQAAIVTYVNWETSEIDAFIEDQEVLIAFLNERRAATITETVTKGLKPNAIMKDTGVAWMGSVPAHWDVHSGRRYFKVRNEKARESDVQLAASQQYGVIEQHRYVELTGNRVVVVQKGFDILKHVESGDFVISMRSFQGGLEYSEVSGQISSAYVMLAPVRPIVDQFFKYLFKSSGYISALRSTSNLVRDGQALRFSNFAQVPVPMPPFSEQEEIANYITYELAEIDAAIADAREAIALSKERRAAVISAAVTGRIDVRDHSITVKAITQGEPIGVA